MLEFLAQSTVSAVTSFVPAGTQNKKAPDKFVRGFGLKIILVERVTGAAQNIFHFVADEVFHGLTSRSEIFARIEFTRLFATQPSACWMPAVIAMRRRCQCHLRADQIRRRHSILSVHDQNRNVARRMIRRVCTLDEPCNTTGTRPCGDHRAVHPQGVRGKAG